LWRVIAECGLDQKGLAGELATINREADLLQGSRHVAKILAKRSGYKEKSIQAALDALSVPDEARFFALVKGIKS
jgi:hypothetical protein